MIVGGPNRIDSEGYYRHDGVHLNNVGFTKYFDFIKACIAHHYRNDGW